jgi:hypothetical protein
MDPDRDVRTREQRFRDGKKDAMYVSKALVKSKAFADLRTPAAYRVLLLFFTKRQMEKRRRPGTRETYYNIFNNGELEFRYSEAERHGISAKQFTRAIDDLVRVGFIDITHSGYGLHRDRTLYALSERWRKFGTDGFQARLRQKRTQQLGFQRANSHGNKCNREKISTAL